jgi:hypothetical protein
VRDFSSLKALCIEARVDYGKAKVRSCVCCAVCLLHLLLSWVFNVLWMLVWASDTGVLTYRTVHLFM